jgi:Uma2 family endonuclease
MPDMNEINFTNVVRDLQKWESCGKKLQELAAEVKERIGDAPIYIDESGKFHIHPDLIAEIDRPENEELYEYLLYMQKNSEAEWGIK